MTDVVVNQLTPAYDVERYEALRRSERVAKETMQVVTLAEHPEIVRAREINLGHRQHSAFNLERKYTFSRHRHRTCFSEGTFSALFENQGHCGF